MHHRHAMGDRRRLLEIVQRRPRSRCRDRATRASVSSTSHWWRRSSAAVGSSSSSSSALLREHHREPGAPALAARQAVDRPVRGVGETHRAERARAPPRVRRPDRLERAAVRMASRGTSAPTLSPSGDAGSCGSRATARERAAAEPAHVGAVEQHAALARRDLARRAPTRACSCPSRSGRAARRSRPRRTASDTSRSASRSPAGWRAQTRSAASSALTRASTKRIRKYGPPISASSAPTGSSSGATATRPIVSADSTSSAPPSAHSGRRMR